jgi:hypothetical protein
MLYVVHGDTSMMSFDKDIASEFALTHNTEVTSVSTWDHIGDVNEMGFLTPEQNETLLVERTVVYKYDEITGRPIVSSYHTQG